MRPQKSRQGVEEMRGVRGRRMEGRACRSSGTLWLEGLRDVVRTRIRSWSVEPGGRVAEGTEGLRVRLFSMPVVVVVNCQARMVVVGGAESGVDIFGGDCCCGGGDGKVDCLKLVFEKLGD